jgi:hypothetical protein
MDNNLLNFKQFVTNASSWLNGSNDNGPNGEPRLPQVSLGMPTTATKEPVQVYSVLRKGKSYEIKAENNVTWNCPAAHYIHLQNVNKAPQVGDKINLEFYRDGSVKSFGIAQKNERGLAD